MTALDSRLVVMIGTALDGRGGMSSVAASYQRQGLFARVETCYLTTHGDGSVGQKLALVFAGLWRLLGLLLRGRVGLVHIHTASGVSFWRKSLFYLLANLFRRPVIMHLHGGEFLEFFRACSAVGRWYVRWVLEGAALVVVLSATWQERVREISPRLRTVVLPNPVAVPDVTGVRQADGLRLLFLGRLEKEKGVFELLEAFAILLGSFPAARLVLAGDGEREAVTECLRSLGIAGQVLMPGWVSGKDKEALLVSSDLFVLPSHIEGLPVSMLEAMAFGVPVVVSRVGSVPEVLRDGENGLMVEAGNVNSLVLALLRLASSADERQRMGEAGRALVLADYAADKVCGQLESIYCAVLNKAESSR